MSALALQSFGFEGQTVRVLDQAGSPWFVAQDVCACLELANSSRAVATLDADEKGITESNTLGGSQQMLIVSESGLYALIFKSRKPSAVRFRKWVTGEVLPMLRTTGRFVMNPADNDDEADRFVIDNPDKNERIRTEALMLRLVENLFGKPAARKLYQKLGWPDLTDGQPMISHRGNLYQPPVDVIRWMAARLVSAPGERIKTSDLADDYRVWAAGNGAFDLSVITFGRALSALGVEKLISDGSWCLGVRLAD